MNDTEDLVEIVETPEEPLKEPVVKEPLKIDPSDPVEEQPISEPEPEQKPVNGFERRVQKLTKAKQDAEAEAAYWRQHATKAAPEPAPVEAKPKFSDFNDIEAYGEAIGAWTAAKAVETALQRRDQERGTRTVLTSYNDRVEEFKKTTPDFDEAFADLDDVPLPQDLMQGILEADQGPALAYYFATHLDEVQRLSAMTPYKRLTALGKIEASLSSKAVPSEKKISAAPSAPKTPNASVSAIKNEDTMSPEEWIRERNKRDKTRR